MDDFLMFRQSDECIPYGYEDDDDLALLWGDDDILLTDDELEEIQDNFDRIIDGETILRYENRW